MALAPADATYLAQLVAARTGLAPAEAQQRVDAVANQLNDAQQKLRQMADAARKRVAHLSMVLALSMLIGAFVASAAAALGGRIRDEYYKTADRTKMFHVKRFGPMDAQNAKWHTLPTPWTCPIAQDSSLRHLPAR